MSDNLTIEQIRNGWQKIHDSLADFANNELLSRGEHTELQLEVLIGIVFNLLNNIEALEQKVEVLSANVQNGLPH